MRLLDLFLVVTMIIAAGLMPWFPDFTPVLITYITVLLIIIYFPLGIIYFKSREQKINAWGLLFGFFLMIQVFALTFYLLFLSGWYAMKWIGLAVFIFSIGVFFILQYYSDAFRKHNWKIRDQLLLWGLIMGAINVVPHQKWVSYGFQKEKELVKTYIEYSNDKSDSIKFQKFSREFYKWKKRE